MLKYYWLSLTCAYRVASVHRPPFLCLAAGSACGVACVHRPPFGCLSAGSACGMACVHCTTFGCLSAGKGNRPPFSRLSAGKGNRPPFSTGVSVKCNYFDRSNSYVRAKVHSSVELAHTRLWLQSDQENASMKNY